MPEKREKQYISGLAQILISQARELESQIGQNFMKIWYSEKILKTIWLPRANYWSQEKIDASSQISMAPSTTNEA